MNAVVRLRGDQNVDSEASDTLEMLNIGAVNHCTLVADTPTYGGMIAKVNDFVAHGEPSVEVVETLLRRRADTAGGDADVDDEWVAQNTAHDGVDDLAAALLAEETTLEEAGLSPVLRLHPPRGGHRGIKTPRGDGGQLGHHTTAEIDALLEAMR